MKKILISLTAVAAMGTSFAFAGQNTMKAPAEPVEIPKSSDEKPSNLKLPLGLYLGGGFTYASTECECKDIGVDTTSEGKTYGVNLKAGYDYNKFIGIEAKYLHTPWGDDGKALKHYGVYLKPNYSFSKNMDLYGLLGYGETKCESQDLDKKGFAWGVGGEYTLNKKKGKKNGVGVYVEYLRPLKKNSPQEITTDVANVGVAYHY